MNNVRHGIIFDAIGPGANRELNLLTADGFHKLIDWVNLQPWFEDFSVAKYEGKDVQQIIAQYFDSNNYAEFMINLSDFISNRVKDEEVAAKIAEREAQNAANPNEIEPPQ